VAESVGGDIISARVKIHGELGREGVHRSISDYGISLKILRTEIHSFVYTNGCYCYSFGSSCSIAA